jgi:hypothetical protein
LGYAFWHPHVHGKTQVAQFLTVDGSRALEYVGIAVEGGGGLLYSHFIAFKVHLEKGDSLAASQELSHIIQCPDFTVDFLAVCLSLLSPLTREPRMTRRFSTGQ